MITAEALWQQVGGATVLTTLSGTLHRLVESQEQIATRYLVNGDLQKQALLEEMLEPSKPATVPGTEHLDYLLATPWRYPPLRHGSRFGTKQQPSLFYGGLSVATTLAEGAYYRWYFYFDMAEPPPRVSSQHSLFQADYHSNKAIALQHEPFTSFRSLLTDKQDYTLTQSLGTVFRNSGVELFEFPSARDPSAGDNIAILSPRSLTSKETYQRTAWLCTTDSQNVVFSYKGKPTTVFQFDVNDFLVQGEFPRPA